MTRVDKVLPAHRAFLEKHYQAHHLLVSGPLDPRTGGVIVTHEMSREDVEAMLLEDPFVLEGVSEYEIIEFKPSRAINP